MIRRALTCVGYLAVAIVQSRIYDARQRKRLQELIWDAEMRGEQR